MRPPADSLVRTRARRSRQGKQLKPYPAPRGRRSSTLSLDEDEPSHHGGLDACVGACEAHQRAAANVRFPARWIPPGAGNRHSMNEMGYARITESPLVAAQVIQQVPSVPGVACLECCSQHSRPRRKQQVVSCVLEERLECSGQRRTGQVASGAVEVEQPDAFG